MRFSGAEGSELCDTDLCYLGEVLEYVMLLEGDFHVLKGVF